jgi:hypothetical protein
MTGWGGVCQIAGGTGRSLGLQTLSTSNNEKLPTDWPALDGTIGTTPITAHCCDKSRLTLTVRQATSCVTSYDSCHPYSQSLTMNLGQKL